MVSIEHLSIEYSSRPILDDITFLINPRDRIALVGKNGAGKTTLLRLLAGVEMPTAGRISKMGELTIGYLPQVMMHVDGKTLREDVMAVYSSQSTADMGGEARFIAEMDRTIIGLGFTRQDFDRPCSEFSGGWRMRIELAKILLQHPDLLLLDEPTNHLDIESIQWLEEFLKNNSSALVLVSHDRAFLDNVTTRTIEITLGRIYDYNVPYTKFKVLRQERHEQQVRAYMNQQKMIQETEEFIERFRYKATKAVQVQSRIKQLEKIERLEVDIEDTSRLNLRFPPAPRSGDFPIIIEDLRKDFGEHMVFQNATFTIRRGEKVAFVGKNGEGKTTLVRCIMGQLDYMGTLKIGHNIKIGYFAQNQAALLDGELTVFQTIDNVAVGDIRTQIRNILGAFMFGGEASEKKVKVLSGGERSRLAMIRLLLEPCNLLILD
jgi:ATP-binding cassette subfamily F protein 3